MATFWTQKSASDLERSAGADGTGLPADGLDALRKWIDEKPVRAQFSFATDYVMGHLVLPTVDPTEGTTRQREVFLLTTCDHVLTVTRGAQHYPVDISDTQTAYDAGRLDTPGRLLESLLSDAAVELTHVVELLQGLVDDVEDTITKQDYGAFSSRQTRVAQKDARVRLRQLRKTSLEVQQAMSPLADRIDGIMNDRLDLEIGGIALFPKDVEVRMRDVHERLLYVHESLDFLRDQIGSVRDYVQAEIANEQNEVMKVLAVGASLLLVPTFIVGMFGQNFRNLPWQDWHDGFWFGFGLIVLVSVLQVVIFLALGWLNPPRRRATVDEAMVPDR
jgi:magnesium transporter